MSGFPFFCSECEREIHPEVETMWTKVTGWEKQREQGGTNALALRRTHQEWMCDGCCRKLKRGVNTKQGALL